MSLVGGIAFFGILFVLVVVCIAGWVRGKRTKFWRDA